MSKLIVTKWNEQILTALMTEGKCRSLTLEPEENESLLGNIYIGKVQNVVKNLNAAFIDLGGGKVGYYSLTENKEPIFADELRRRFADDDANSSAPRLKERKIKQGDELVVQISRDAVKTKAPVLSCYLNFTGKYAVLTMGKGQTGFSSKITDTSWKNEVRAHLKSIKDPRFGIIVRTNAAGLPAETIADEVISLRERMENLLHTAACRTCFTVLESSEPSYIQSLRDTYTDSLEEIVTDLPACYRKMQEYLTNRPEEEAGKLTLYEDEQLPLIKLLNLESVIKEASGNRVWLKSGGYLVIEPTEALTVIDVNTGKYSGEKTVAEAILKINLEAAVETARQLTLRNLSGIIIVDFIDMESEEHKQILLNRLEEELRKDPVKTVLVEMTKLGLVEITQEGAPALPRDDK